MKIIDLFVKIANKENVPKKLLYKYKNKEFYEEYLLEWFDKHKAYFYVSNEDGKSYPIVDLLADNLWNLNDELEIIEEKPQEIGEWGEATLEEIKKRSLNLNEVNTYLRVLANTQQELIKAVNYFIKERR